MRIAVWSRGRWLPGGAGAYATDVSLKLTMSGHEIVFWDTETVAPFYDTSFESAAAFSRAVDSAGIDAIHAHGSLPIGRYSSLPIVRTVHNHGLYCSSGSKYLFRPSQPCGLSHNVAACTFHHLADGCGSRVPARVLADMRRRAHDQRSLRQAGAIVCPNSSYTADELARIGVPAWAIKLNPLPAPPPAPIGAQPARIRNRLIFVGRLTYLKGADRAIAAVAKLGGFTLDIVGDGPQRTSLERLSNELGVRSRVNFHGWLPAEAAQEKMLTAEALLVPSRWQEPLGLVALEAMTYGTPVVASDVGGLGPLIRESRAGALCGASDLESLVGGVRAVTQDPDAWARYSHAGLYHAAHEASSKTHINVLLECLRASRELSW